MSGLLANRIYRRRGVGARPPASPAPHSAVARVAPLARVVAARSAVARGARLISSVRFQGAPRSSVCLDSRVPRARLFVYHQRSERSAVPFVVFAGIEYFSDLPSYSASSRCNKEIDTKHNSSLTTI